jgi:hypothetical protein
MCVAVVIGDQGCADRILVRSDCEPGIAYYDESQQRGEAAPVADRHLQPAEPRSLRLALRVTL